MKTKPLYILSVISLISLCGMQAKCHMVRNKVGCVYVSGYIRESDLEKFNKMIEEGEKMESKKILYENTNN